MRRQRWGLDAITGARGAAPTGSAESAPGPVTSRLAPRGNDVSSTPEVHAATAAVRRRGVRCADSERRATSAVNVSPKSHRSLGGVLPRTEPRRGRWKRRSAISVCLILIAAGLGGIPVYVRPQVDPLRHADAILVIGGYGEERYRLGIELSTHGWAPNLVVSNPVGAGDVWKRNYCSTPPVGVTVHCFAPDPPTTKGEARELRRLATQYGWHTVIVVTFKPHISRARYILEKCFNGDLVMVASPTHVSAFRWAYEYLYQTAGYLRAAFQPGC